MSFNDNNVLPSHLREVIGDTTSTNSAADDDCLRVRCFHLFSPRKYRWSSSGAASATYRDPPLTKIILLTWWFRYGREERSPYSTTEVYIKLRFTQRSHPHTFLPIRDGVVSP